jgi:7,8-dihydropterin-6-yl-methyl-4-(beta-D-ribofuranosyl)aminobenzene 5'-phosphate synthase
MRKLFLVAAVLAWANGGPVAAESSNRVTILYDAFGSNPAMKKDWGYSAFVEYGGKRVLFDTGNNPDVFAHNAEAARVDLKRLDFVVISHRHLDHTAGLGHLLRVNRQVKIYVPQEVLGGVFGTSAPSSFYRKEAGLPEHMRYYDARPPEKIVLGSAWVSARTASGTARLSVRHSAMTSARSDARSSEWTRRTSSAFQPSGYLCA